MPKAYVICILLFIFHAQNKPGLSISFELQLVDSVTTGLIAHFFKGVLTLYMKKILIEAKNKLFRSILHLMKKVNCRGEAIQLHLGFWGKHARKNTLYKTADSRTNANAVKLFLFETQIIWDAITKLIEKKYPNHYSRLIKMKQYWNCPYTWGLWHALAYNVNLQSMCHQDFQDDKYGIAVIIPVGDFTGGELTLNQFDLDFQNEFGDIFVCSSALYLHENQPITSGERDSIVLFNSCECSKMYNK